MIVPKEFGYQASQLATGIFFILPIYTKVELNWMVGEGVCGSWVIRRWLTGASGPEIEGVLQRRRKLQGETYDAQDKKGKQRKRSSQKAKT